jgi:hypothetical protein
MNFRVKMTNFDHLLYTGQVRSVLAISPPEYQDLLTEAVAIFNKNNLSDEEAGNIGKFALEWCPHEIVKSEVDILDDCLYIEHFVDLDVHGVVKLDWDFSGSMADKFKNMRCESIMVSFSTKLILDERYEATRQLELPYREYYEHNS